MLTPGTHHARGRTLLTVSGLGSFLAPALEHTCEGLKQHFGDRVTCIQAVF